MFQSVEDVQQRFRAARYIAGRRIATVVYLAARMNRPVLIEGPAGVGKTELAKTLAELTGRPLIRCSATRGSTKARRCTNGNMRSSSSIPSSSGSASAS